MRTKFAPLTFVLLCLLVSSLPCQAQWLTQRIGLVPGWNAIFLEVQPEPNACADVFKNLPVESVWKWDRRFSTIQFTVDPATLLDESPDWLLWMPPSNPRAFLNRLYALQGCQAYLVKVATNAAPFTLALKGRVVLPHLEWYPHGLNLVGLPVHSQNPPTFSEFFRFTSEVDTSRSYANELYRLDAQGKGQRIVLPARERIQPGVAYWIGCARAIKSPSSLQVGLGGAAAVEFGSVLVERDLTLRNLHPVNPMTIRLRQLVSETPPATGSAAELAGPVPLSSLVKETNNQWFWADFPSAGLSKTLAPGQEWSLRLGVRRGDMAAYTPVGTNGAIYQSILEVTDAGESLRIRVPVTAERSTASQVSSSTLEQHNDHEGLWVGKVTLNQVNAPAYTTDVLPTPAPMSFRLLLHVDGYGRANLLQQVVLAWDSMLTNAPHTNGSYALYADERALPGSATNVNRIASAAFPVMAPLAMTGQFTNTLAGQVAVQFDDRTNPFLHRYHPRHDNRDWGFKAYTNAVESRTILRDLVLTFNTLTNSSTNLSYGVNLTSGSYQETLSGLRAQPVVVRGAFALQRISQISQIQGITP